MNEQAEQVIEVKTEPVNIISNEPIIEQVTDQTIDPTIEQKEQERCLKCNSTNIRSKHLCNICYSKEYFKNKPICSYCDKKRKVRAKNRCHNCYLKYLKSNEEEIDYRLSPDTVSLIRRALIEYNTEKSRFNKMFEKINYDQFVRMCISDAYAKILV